MCWGKKNVKRQSYNLCVLAICVGATNSVKIARERQAIMLVSATREFGKVRSIVVEGLLLTWVWGSVNNE